MNTSNKTTTPTNQNVTTYEAATHLLSLPKAKLTGKERRACQLARDGAPRPEWVADHSRGSKRRVSRLANAPDAPQPQAPKSGTERLIAKLKKKNWLQLNAVITRGYRRGNRALELAALASAPKIKAAYRAASTAFFRTAAYAESEADSRKAPEVCA